MAIFEEDDSDTGSVTSFYSDSSIESDEQEESNSSNWSSVPKTLPSFKGKNIMYSNEEEIWPRYPISFRSRVLASLLSERDLGDRHSSLGKRPPSTRPAPDSQVEQSGSFNITAFAPPAVATTYSATQGGYTRPAHYDSDPTRPAPSKLIEEDRTSCPEWRQLYLSVPLGSLPSVEDCNNLAPPQLKILAIVPIREVLHTRESNTPTVQSISKSQKSKKLAPVKAPTLRPNSATLFCYKKVDDKYYCQLPRIVNE
ncbi:hypothetical protein BGZ95_004258, partial [Linnemannia exigua]